METFETNPKIDPNVDVMGVPKETGIKNRLGQIGRRIKRVDLRDTIVTHPFAAVGIVAAAGALVGVLRPKPQPGRITSAVVATLGAIGFRLVREAAVTQLGGFAKQWLRQNAVGQSGATQAPQSTSSNLGTPAGY